MTRKHLEAIAARLLNIRPLTGLGSSPDAVALWRSAVVAMADVCAEFCPRFNRSRFYNACNFTP